MRRIPIGPVGDVPTDRCVAVGDGLAIALRIGDEVCAYRNQCLHQESPLAGGIVRDGVLMCPLHFWRYDARSGRVTTGTTELERFPVEIVDGEAVVLLPDERPRRSLREDLLERARTYERASQYERDRERRDASGSCH
jgi:3-phenylpropionate/trans-cinnamate dioxygenase ferredoxin subunit